ncbi:hypothetical protein PV08_00574 [Exophiala spinifera]|uniref:Uncharacterized protein n=1 Tax=Exophiala spinifera TaxID=91928 RepID=A0A0D2C907_9EURO|nr:uncharacterized protein PV08_00574 [Exophiala spinifera]KIW19999.1 hypothetical protein PV08_00574 [Exophiala spinifera]
MDSSRVLVFARQVDNNTNNDNFDDGYWWYSSTAYAIKWAIIAAILVALFLFFIVGYLHARRRMRKGQPPLAYHRWLVPRSQRMAFAQQYPQYAAQAGVYSIAARPMYHPYGPGQQAYPMGAYGPPPPAYHEPDYVPVYTPPSGNKVDPDQNRHYTPPSGPPPTGGPSQPPPVATTGGASYGR